MYGSSVDRIDTGIWLSSSSRIVSTLRIKQSANASGRSQTGRRIGRGKSELQPRSSLQTPNSSLQQRCICIYILFFFGGWGVGGGNLSWILFLNASSQPCFRFFSQVSSLLTDEKRETAALIVTRVKLLPRTLTLLMTSPTLSDGHTEKAAVTVVLSRLLNVDICQTGREIRWNAPVSIDKYFFYSTHTVLQTMLLRFDCPLP